MLTRKSALAETNGESQDPAQPVSRPEPCNSALAATLPHRICLQAGHQACLPMPSNTNSTSLASSLYVQSPTTRVPVKSDCCHLTAEAKNQLASNDPTPLHPPNSGVVVQGAFGHMAMQAKNDLSNIGTFEQSTFSQQSSGNCSPSPSASVTKLPPETREELQDVLDTYRNVMFPFSPIVAIGPEVTVEHMATERPYTWLLMRMICTKRLARQLALGAEIDRLIAQKLVIQGERSFDMLCALVIHVNWGQFSNIRANLSPPIYLALGLAGDLGLTKPPLASSPAVMMNWTQARSPKPPYALVIRKRTLEERRVVLGLFYVTSICANFFQRNETMRFTPYLEESLKLLTESNDQSTDQLLAYLIRVQTIANSLQAVGWNDTYPLATGGERVSRMHYTQVHKLQLDDLRRSLPDHLKNNAVLKYHILGVEISLYTQYLQPPSSTLTPLEQQKHVEGLWSCFSTVRTYVDMFVSTIDFPIESYLYVSMANYTILGHALVALFRLSIFESEHVPWDRQYVVNEMDLGDVVNRWIDMLARSPQVNNIDISGAGRDSQWENSTKILLSTVLQWWETKVRPSIMDTASEEQEHGGLQTAQPPVDGKQHADEPFDATMNDFEDSGDWPMDFNVDSEPWMRDLFSGGFNFKAF